MPAPPLTPLQQALGRQSPAAHLTNPRRSSTMAPPKRRASIVAEATNKRLAAQQQAEEREAMGVGVSMSNETSPLTSLQTVTPSPPASMGLDMERENEDRENRGGSLVRQIQKIRSEGLEVQVGEGSLRVKGKEMGAKGRGGGGNGKKDGNTPKIVKVKRGMVPPSTPANRAGIGSREGNMQKKSNGKYGTLPLSNIANGGASGKLQKRSASEYLDDAPDDAEKEREHERPAKRQWSIAMPPPFQSPMIYQNQQQLRKVTGDPALFALTGPPYTTDPNHADLSNFLWAEIHRKREPPQLELLPGLLQLPQSRPGPLNAAYVPSVKSSTDSLGSHTKHLRMLDDLKKKGLLRGEEAKENHRLHTRFVKLMGDQRRDMFIKNSRPIDTEDFFRRQPPIPDFKYLALAKLKPARNRVDPALFGTWHNSKPMREEDAQGCTFCMFDCDFGVSDERVWLPIEASGGFCRACHEATMESYHELEFLNLNAEVVGDLSDDVQERLDMLGITAATPPLKELGDKMRFKVVASVYMSERTRPSVSPQTPGNVYAMENMGQQQVMRALNGASASQSSSPMMRSAPASPQVPMSVFAGMSAQQQQQFLMANGSRCVANQNPSPQAWAAFLSGLGPRQRQFMMMHVNADSGGQTCQIMQGVAGSPPVQASMSNRARAPNILTQRRLSNGSNPPASPQMTPNSNSPQLTQQMGGAVNEPGASPLMQLSILMGAQIPIQRRLSNSSIALAPSQTNLNGNTASHTLKNGQPAHGVTVTSATSSRARNGAGSPPMEPSMLNSRGNAKNVNQRRLPTSGSRPAPPSQIIPNGRSTPNAQQVAPTNGVAEGSIALTRSGGVIAPTSIQNSAGVASNISSRPPPNGTNHPASDSATITQRRLSNGQQMMRSVIGPSGNDQSRNGTGTSNTTHTRPQPSGSNPPAPVKAAIDGRENPNAQKMARSASSNPQTPNAGSPTTNGAPSPMPLQPNGRRVSNPPFMATPRALPSTPGQIPTNQTPSSSPISAPSNTHAHPYSYLHRSQTAPVTPSDPMGPPPRPPLQRTVSATDGCETTIYQGVLFCRGSAWRQVDVRKARICEECKEEKFSITKHRHTKFYLLCEKRGLAEGEGIGWGGVTGGEGKKSGCMVCTEIAGYGCEGCPLRVCVDCEVKLTMMCKGYLNNLIYMHGDRTHIRNDAFLLRSDGGGF